MKKNVFWMFAAILTCGLMMTSCAVEDRPVAPASGAAGGGTAGGASDEEYKIVVGEGMTMPENAFLKVAAVAGNQNIINPLKAIDKQCVRVPQLVCTMMISTNGTRQREPNSLIGSFNLVSS